MQRQRGGVCVLRAGLQHQRRAAPPHAECRLHHSATWSTEPASRNDRIFLGNSASSRFEA
jgi:hypothetical protein